jgi:hypothetical protein
MKRRLVKGGPEVACRIRRLCHCTHGAEDGHDWTDACDRFPPLLAEINGRIDERPGAVDRLWTSAEIIDEAEWLLLTGRREWDERHDPDAPSQRPADAIDPLTSRLAF